MPASAAVVGSFVRGPSLRKGSAVRLPQPVTTQRAIDWPQDEDARRVLDLAGGVLRREPEINDDRVTRIGRIDLTVRAADELFVLPDRAERGCAERRRLDPSDLDSRDSCFGEARHSENHHEC